MSTSNLWASLPLVFWLSGQGPSSNQQTNKRLTPSGVGRGQNEMQQARTREKINMHTKLLFIRIFIFPQPSHRNHARTHAQKAQHAPRPCCLLEFKPGAALVSHMGGIKMARSRWNWALFKIKVGVGCPVVHFDIKFFVCASVRDFGGLAEGR